MEAKNTAADPTFCTIVSSLRAYQAIALFISLQNVLSAYIVYVLCVDDGVYELLRRMNFKHIVPMRVDDLNDNALAQIKKQRKLNEYCWTLKPVLIERLFSDYAAIRRITYIDADLFFWNSPDVIFSDQADASVLLSRGDIIIPMLPLPLINILQDLMGNYNSGFISFHRDQNALDCLAWWKNSCLDSCISKPGNGEFGDQKYLDDMPGLFQNVQEITTPGVNIGHWNNANHFYAFFNGHLYIDYFKLICYHFSGFRILKDNSIIRIHEADRLNIPFFYEIYTEALAAIIRTVKIIYPEFEGYSTDEDMPAQ